MVVDRKRLNNVCLPKTHRLTRKDGVMASSALLIHVPVDRVEITSGPSQREWGTIFDTDASSDLWFDLELTMRTPASGQTFKREITVVQAIPEVPNPAFLFRARFNRDVVHGRYDFRVRTGWFEHISSWPKYHDIWSVFIKI